MTAPRTIGVVDLFCGAGGLAYGLSQAGLSIRAGIDNDPQAGFAFTANCPGSSFHALDLKKVRASDIEALYSPGDLRLLAGGPPCQPFSKLTNGAKRHRAWNLLSTFGGLVEAIRPELVVLENVPELVTRGRDVFERFLRSLDANGYKYDWKVVHCPEYGIPQYRRRLVLLASSLGLVAIPEGATAAREWKTVRKTFKGLRPLKAGEQDSNDPIHASSRLSDLNLRRIRATPHNGGSRDSWPDDLVLDCHRRESGSKYVSVYGRMSWDEPAPTMTTLCTGIGNGRFGHPTQDRAISLREAALLQSFPPSYKFWPTDQEINRKAIGRLIGNAVPPALAEVLGEQIRRCL